jgi:uncharacterized protein
MSSMRIAVIADTHMPRGSRVLPGGCVERLQEADLILHAGDLTGIAFLDELCSFGRPVEAIHGNMDEPDVQRRLPEERVVEVGPVRIGMVHVPGPAVGRAERLAARFPGCAAVVYGHTHVAEIAHHCETWILNPGSPTERRRSPSRSMLWLTVTGDRIDPDLLMFGS